jgi:hypothetical protein
MVPAAYVVLDALPLTPNGKVDRRALPAPDMEAFARQAYAAPEGEVETLLAAIWAEVLHVERVGRHDDFFALGGHSLLAVQVVSRVRHVLEVEVALAELFREPRLADFARVLAMVRGAVLPPMTPVERDAQGVPREVPALSFAQERLWFLEQLGSVGAAYHISWGLRLRGQLDAAALQRALDQLVARHEALRTTFAQVDGVAQQVIAPAAQRAFALVTHDLRGEPDGGAMLRQVAGSEAEAAFDLARGPLIRGRLLRLADDEHALLVTMHHIVTDGWSMGVFLRELSVLYAAFTRGEPDPLPPLRVQYADYAVWQRAWVTGEVLEAQTAYWRTALAGAPELLELPTDHPRPAVPDYAGAEVPVVLDAVLTAGLKALAQRHGVTLFHVLLAAWAAVLSRLAGQDEVVIGTPTANRGQMELEGLIGFFVNTLAIRVELGGAPTVTELLQRVKTRALGAQAHEALPFEQVVELVNPTRSLAHHPVFQAMFAWQNAPGGELAFPALTVAPLGADAAPRATAKFDLTLTLWEQDGRIVGGLEYATALFGAATVERHLGYLGTVLAALAADAAIAVSELPLLSAAERALVVETWNATGMPEPAAASVYALFAAQAARTPDQVAVVYENEQLTYDTLNRRANQLAQHLRAHGVGLDSRVALCLERGVDLVVALLAVLKTGGAYVPLDPSHPVGRLRYMLADSAPAAVVTTQAALAAEVQQLLGSMAIPVVDVGDAGTRAELARQSLTNPAESAVDATQLAYVI